MEDQRDRREGYYVRGRAPVVSLTNKKGDTRGECPALAKNTEAKYEEMAKKEFEERVRETKKQAIIDNIEKAKKSGNVLTQSMDDEGNLIGVTETVNFDEREATTEEATREYNENLAKSIQESTPETKE